MATSSKVRFHLDTLQAKSIESIEFRIAQAELHVASYDDDEALAQRIHDWRARQEAKISDLFRDLGEIDDYRLSKFTLDSIPSVDRYERRDAVRALERLTEKKSKMVAKADSLVADEDGNVSLTTTQLSEFFDL